MLKNGRCGPKMMITNAVLFPVVARGLGKSLWMARESMLGSVFVSLIPAGLSFNAVGEW